MPDQAPQTLDEILHKYEIGFVTHGRDVNEHFNSYKQALTSLIEQARQEGVKDGFYYGQANAGVTLEQCHENWKQWNINAKRKKGDHGTGE